MIAIAPGADADRIAVDVGAFQSSFHVCGKPRTGFARWMLEGNVEISVCGQSTREDFARARMIERNFISGHPKIDHPDLTGTACVAVGHAYDFLGQSYWSLIGAV